MTLRGRQLPSFRGMIVALIAVGTVARLLLAALTDGVPYDLESFRLVEHSLNAHGLSVYSSVNAGHYPRWPYPPGYFPWILACREIHAFTGLGLFFLYRLPPIAADAAIAWLVQWFLGTRGASHQTRLAATALVAVGPSFAAISGHHGQIDSVAILPAVVGLILWYQPGLKRRALWAGLLIGAGAALKTVPGLMVLALLPTARSREEGAVLALSALAVPLVLVIPFAIPDPHGVSIIYRYHGATGLGGLSLLAQPDLPTGWFALAQPKLSDLSDALRAHATVFTLAGIGVTTLIAFARRLAPTDAAVLLWLSIYAFGVGFFLQYMVWGIPFLLIAGYVRQAAMLEGALLVPTLVNYIGPGSTRQVWILYTVPMLVVWAAMTASYVLVARKAISSRGGRPEAVPT